MMKGETVIPDFSRRTFLKGTVALTLTLQRLHFPSAFAGGPSEPSAQSSPDMAAYRSWEDIYREKWTWDRIVHGTHLWANCAAACSWNLFVKDGVVWREEQAPVYNQTNPSLPDFNPRGCQKGGCYSSLMYSPSRLKYPMRRVGPRGSGKWEKISWDEALNEIADKMIDVCLEDGPQSIYWDFGNIDFGPGSAAQMRLFSLMGVPTPDMLAGTGDFPLGAAQTWGLVNVDGTADDWCHSDFILVWSMNPSYTRIPEAHFLWEARYRGTTVVSVAPDYNASTIHADLWINPRVSTDTALALSMAQVIVSEKLYKESYVQEQTDLPFLVREDTRCFLREKDLKEGGKEDVFYLWDTKTRALVEAPGTAGHRHATLRLDEVSPALHGRYWATLKSGQEVRVRPVFAVLEQHLAAYTPEKAEEVTGVGAELIRQTARRLAQAKAVTILASFGSCKHYHSDVMQRSMILLLALTGNQGKRGGGLRLSALWSLSGFEWLAGAHEPTFFQKLALRFYRPSVRMIEDHMAKFMKEEFPFYPNIPWLWMHGGLKEVLEKDHPQLGPALEEALSQDWLPLFPAREKDPKIFVATGANALRRWPVPQTIEKTLWPKLKLVFTVDFRLSTTALKSDIVLPAAGYYEKRGIKYAYTYLPYIVFGNKAVEPLGESKGEWEIYGLLARKIQERAKERGVGAYKSAVGKDKDLRKIYDVWSEEGKYPAEDDRPALDYIMKNSKSVVDCTWEEGVEKGAVRIQGVGMYGPGNATCSDFQAGETIYPSQWFVEQKEPWPTLTGRQQFYLDHPWFLAAGEELPAYSEPPAAGGEHPLRLTGGHTRWSIHAIWRDQSPLLRLQRGEPVAFMSAADAQARDVRDHDQVKVFNDVGSFQVHVKISPAVQPGQIVIYHAWEPYQFEKWNSTQDVIPSPFKPTHLVGNYGHIRYRGYYLSPGYTPRGTRVDVAKV